MVQCNMKVNGRQRAPEISKALLCGALSESSSDVTVKPLVAILPCNDNHTHMYSISIRHFRGGSAPNTGRSVSLLLCGAKRTQTAQYVSFSCTCTGNSRVCVSKELPEWSQSTQIVGVILESNEVLLSFCQFLIHVHLHVAIHM